MKTVLLLCAVVLEFLRHLLYITYIRKNVKHGKLNLGDSTVANNVTTTVIHRV